MTKAAASNVVVSLDQTVKVGRNTYKLSDLISHTAKQYDTLYLLQEEQLGLYKAIGESLIQIKSLFNGNKKAFGQFIAKTELGSMTMQDRSDAMEIAKNWNVVQKLNKDGKLDRLGVSAIRKRIDAVTKPKAPKSAGNVSKGKKAQAKPEAMTEVELAQQVYADIKTYGLDMAKFAKALAEIHKAS